MSGILSADTIDVTNISSGDSTGVTINDNLLITGTLKAEGSTFLNIEDNTNISGILQVDEIVGNDSSAVQINNIDVVSISSSTSTAIQVNDAVNISGALSVDTLDTNQISSGDSTAIQINDAVNINGQLLINNNAFVLPSLDTTARDALTAINGMLIYNTSTSRIEAYENDAWVPLRADTTDIA